MASLNKRMRQSWNGENAPLVDDCFKATVRLCGDKAIPLMEMANRHREAGYKVEETHFLNVVREFSPAANSFTDRQVPFVHISIRRSQLEFGRDA